MNIEKLKIYLETTVFNYYFDDREGHDDVLKLFKAIEAGEFEAYTSNYVMDELNNAPEPKRSNMIALATKHDITVLDSSDKVRRLNRLYIERGAIPASQVYDSLHVAIASAFGLECIISYNFQHINRSKTKILTAVINREEGYNGIIIATAKEVLNDE